MDSIQIAFMLASPFLGGWIGAGILGTKGLKAAVASFIAAGLGISIVAVFPSGDAAIFGAFAVSSIATGLVFRMDFGQIGGMALGLCLATLAGLAITTRLPELATEINAKNFYDCENLKSEVLRASKENKDQNGGVYIIGLVEEYPQSTSDKETRCIGTAIYSNTSKIKIVYRAHLEYEQWWIEYKPTL